MPSPRELPFPPVELRQLVGPTDESAFDNPDGGLVFPQVPVDCYAEVFDFGCGCGRIARRLIQQHARPRRYFGIDVHRGMVGWCQRNLAPQASGFEFAHHDVYSRCMNPGDGKPMTLAFPASDRSATLVVAWSVFTHLVESQVAFYLRECARVLKPGGVLVSTWFLFDKRHFPMMQEFQNGLYINVEDPSNATIFDRAWLVDQARAAGLVIHGIEAPSVRGFQWTILMSPAQPGLQEAGFPEDLAPFGVARPPVPTRGVSALGLDADAGSAAAGIAKPDRATLVEWVKALGPWFHAIDLGDGVRTACDPVYGGDETYPLALWERLRPVLPDVRGLRILDVGCNAGFFSVEMKRAGAARVLGIEAGVQFGAQAQLVREALGLDIEFLNMSCYDLSPQVGVFDLSLVLGVIYHLKNPLLGLQKIAAVTTDVLVVESAIVAESGRPSSGKYLAPSRELVFIDNGMVGDGPGIEGFRNWFVPTFACLKAFLAAVGFGTIVAEVEDGERALIVARRG